MKVLITGGAGYIGSHISDQLISQGYDVIVYDNLSTGFKEAVPTKAKFILGDVRDTEKLSSALKNESIEVVIHLAAKLILLESIKDPLLYYGNNTVGVLSLVQACRQSSVNKIVFSSSASVYGDSVFSQSNQSLLFVENSPKNPITPYGWSKLHSEQILKDAENAYGIQSVSLRFFNAAGASIDSSNGQRSAYAGHLIKICAEAACGKRKLVEIFGDNYPTADGTGVRDYIHVQDLADIHTQALKYLLRGGRSESFNCGYGKGYSVKEVIHMMKQVSGVDFSAHVTSRREGDASCLIADSSRMREVLSWTPKFDSLELICKTAYEWEKRI